MKDADTIVLPRLGLPEAAEDPWGRVAARHRASR